jgi:hypothetical protein
LLFKAQERRSLREEKFLLVKLEWVDLEVAKKILLLGLKGDFYLASAQRIKKVVVF